MPERFDIIAHHGNPQEMVTIPRADHDRLRAIEQCARIATQGKTQDERVSALGELAMLVLNEPVGR